MDLNSGIGENEIRALLAGGGIRAVYQPIVDLESLKPVAYEALARGPAGSPLESPDKLFPAAGAAGCIPAVDRACRAAAIDGAVRPAETDPFTLFVNVDPAAIDGSPLFEADQQERILRDRVRVVVELPERALIAQPLHFLAAVTWLRSRGVGVALDDAGLDRRALALTPFIRPDVVKLDMGLVHERPSARTAAIAHAVGAEAERSGAQVLAEGIETEEHLRRAIALGATLGQGWLFGRPDDLPEVPARRAVLRSRRFPSGHALRTPFRIVTQNREPRRGDHGTLLNRSRQLEAHAAELGPDTLVLNSVHGVVGLAIDGEPAPGFGTGAVDASDPLADERCTVVLSPHFAAVLVARDLGDRGPDEAHRFDYAVTYDRELVTAAASSILARIVPQLGRPVEYPTLTLSPSDVLRA